MEVVIAKTFDLVETYDDYGGYILWAIAYEGNPGDVGIIMHQAR